MEEGRLDMSAKKRESHRFVPMTRMAGVGIDVQVTVRFVIWF